jgi:hypothetical protein
MPEETWVNPFNEDGSINENLIPESQKQNQIDVGPGPTPDSISVDITIKQPTEYINLELKVDDQGDVDPAFLTKWLKDQGWNVIQIGPSTPGEEGNIYNLGDDDIPEQCDDNDTFYL